MTTSWLRRGRALLCRPAMLLPRWPVCAVTAASVRYGVAVLGAGVVGASGVMMVARAEEEEEDGGQRAVTEAEAQSAEQLLAEYFRTTEPAPGGRGAVRLRRELVSSDGQQGVAEYVQSLTTAAAADATAAGGRETTAQTGGQLDEPPPPRLPWSPTTLQQIRVKQAAFAQARDWDQFHTPRNILLALVGEVGELAEIFQWKGDGGAERGLPSFTGESRAHVAQELSDVLLYLIRLADVCEIDLGAAVLAKMEVNAAKYPAELARGRADKYTAYTQQQPSGTKQ